MVTKILLIGCGDVAIRLASLLPVGRFQLHGLRRHPEQLPANIRPIAWDLNRAEGLVDRITGFDVVVITLVPGSRDAAGYQRAYVGNMQNIIGALEASSSLPNKPKLVLFVSSTSVYGQNQGEWVDERSPTEPRNFRGQAVLQSEQLLRQSTLNHCILRFSGIYGRGNARLIEQVKCGDFSEKDHDYSNRIHVDDCAGVLAHLTQRALNGNEIESCYLASDCEPLALIEVKRWIAEQMGLPFSEQNDKSASPGSKRCSNKRLLGSGYEFKYPSFWEGYAEIISS